MSQADCGLSRQERWVLVQLLEVEPYDGTGHTTWMDYLVGRRAWRSPAGASRSQQASLCRSLRRLQARGLVERARIRGQRRTVLLLPAGVEVAQRLTRNTLLPVNRWSRGPGAVITVEPLTGEGGSEAADATAASSPGVSTSTEEEEP